MNGNDFALHVLANAAVYEFAQGYLVKRGWFESLPGMPKDQNGFVPWITYPALRQLARIVKPECRVFEYGCGGSSLWWAQNVSSVVSVEHDPDFARKIAKNAPANLEIVVRPQGAICSPARQAAIAPFIAALPQLPSTGVAELDVTHGLDNESFAAYATELLEYPPESFDVIVVDGMARALCAWLAARSIKPNGVIVFDNADRWHYNPGYRALHDMGFKRLDYYGPGPISRTEWCTSLFVRTLDAFADNIESQPGDSDFG